MKALKSLLGALAALVVSAIIFFAIEFIVRLFMEYPQVSEYFLGAVLVGGTWGWAHIVMFGSD